MKQADFGTVSHGTLRHEDLIPAFCDKLEELRAENLDENDTSLFGAIAARVSEVRRRMQANDYFNTEEAQWDIEELGDLLNEFTPEFAYFGTLEGDGSDFGFWPDWTALEDEEYEGWLLRVSDLSQVPEEPEVNHVMVVNDHGNATLYNVQEDNSLQELWTVV